MEDLKTKTIKIEEPPSQAFTMLDFNPTYYRMY